MNPNGYIKEKYNEAVRTWVIAQTTYGIDSKSARKSKVLVEMYKELAKGHYFTFDQLRNEILFRLDCLDYRAHKGKLVDDDILLHNELNKTLNVVTTMAAYEEHVI